MVDILNIDNEVKQWPKFRSGDEIEVGFVVRNKDNSKSRVQLFKGRVIAMKNKGFNASATVRKISNGFAVERAFQLNSPDVDSIKVTTRGKVKRAKLFYLRALSGKKARIASRISKKKNDK